MSLVTFFGGKMRASETTAASAWPALSLAFQKVIKPTIIHTDTATDKVKTKWLSSWDCIILVSVFKAHVTLNPCALCHTLHLQFRSAAAEWYKWTPALSSWVSHPGGSHGNFINTHRFLCNSHTFHNTNMYPDRQTSTHTSHAVCSHSGSNGNGEPILITAPDATVAAALMYTPHMSIFCHRAVSSRAWESVVRQFTF